MPGVSKLARLIYAEIEAHHRSPQTAITQHQLAEKYGCSGEEARAAIRELILGLGIRIISRLEPPKGYYLPLPAEAPEAERAYVVVQVKRLLGIIKRIEVYDPPLAGALRAAIPSDALDTEPGLGL